MPVKLKAQLQRFLELLSMKSAGEMLSEDEILAETGWKPATLDTHRRKRFLDPFLAQEGKGVYRVLRDGNTLTPEEVSDAFTQNRPGHLALAGGMVISSPSKDYELISFLGNGAAAHVWKCKDRSTGEFCAAKIMSPRQDLLDPINLEDLRKRFSREARNGQRISHPNIVAHKDYGDVSEYPFLIMHLADESLADMLRRDALTVSTALKIVESCLLGLDHLHDNGHVHRDMKPSNILRFGSRFAIGDLGIVRWSDMNPAFTTAGTLTQESVRLGSWYYMAPEQRRSPHTADSASDIYALGISWYEMLTRVALDPAEVAARQFVSACSDVETSDIIRSMLSYAPADRPTAKQLIERVRALGSRLSLAT